MTGDASNPAASLDTTKWEPSIPPNLGDIGKLRPANHGALIRHAKNRQKKTEGFNSVMDEVTQKTFTA
jgi:hypothetical protein